MRTIDAVALPDVSTQTDLVGRDVVVIDLLRASTTIVAALDAGARGVVPIECVEDARAYARDNPRALLGGERSAQRIDGFDLGNSPLEYTPDVVGGRVIALTTTNGTRALQCSRGAARILIGALTNRAALVDLLMLSGRDVLLICSGTDGKVSEEDCFGAGMIADLLAGKARLTDRAKKMRVDAHQILESQQGPEGVLRSTFHGGRLVQLGHDADIRWASEMDSSRSVPVLDDVGMLVVGR